MVLGFFGTPCIADVFQQWTETVSLNRRIPPGQLAGHHLPILFVYPGSWLVDYNNERQ